MIKERTCLCITLIYLIADNSNYFNKRNYHTLTNGTPDSTPRRTELWKKTISWIIQEGNHPQESKAVDDFDDIDDGGDATSSYCFKSSVNMAAAALASSSAIWIEYAIASFVLSMYLQTNLTLVVLS